MCDENTFTYELEFADGFKMIVRERTYSRAIVVGSHDRLVAGAETNRQLSVARGWRRNDWEENGGFRMQEQIQIAAQMYRARDAVVSLLGTEKFKKRVDGFRPVLQRVCDVQEVSKIEAMIKMLDKAGDDGNEVLMITALCTEIIEPSLGAR